MGDSGALILILQWISAAFAAGAAGFWFASARVPLINKRTGGVFDTASVRNVSQVQLDRIVEALKRQAEYSAIAATCAATAAVVHLLSLGLNG